MAKYRYIHTCFWSDDRVLDEMNFKEKYFYLYLLTNSRVNQCGCYTFSKKQAIIETDLVNDEIEEMLEKFDNELNIVRYSKEKKEILLLNFYKYNWTSSPKVIACILKEVKEIKEEKFKNYIKNLIENQYGIDTLSIGLGEKEKEKEKEKVNKNKNKNKTILSGKPTSGLSQTPELTQNCYLVVSYLNEKTNSKYSVKAESTRKLIKSLLNDYSVDDIIMVIDKMCYLWNREPKKGEKDMRLYLRPSTLFRRSNFENYFGMNVPQKKVTTADLVKNMDFSDFR